MLDYSGCTVGGTVINGGCIVIVYADGCDRFTGNEMER